MNTHYSFSIITVNYNSGDLLSNLIKSIYDHIDHSFEIIVVDNCSSDKSIELVNKCFKHKDNLKIVINQTNTGFSYANNQGAEIANGRFLHFLNPDTIVSHDLNKLYSEILIDCKDAIYVTSLKDFEGNELKSKQKIPTLTNYYNCLFRKGKIQYWYTGASLVMSSKVFDKIEKWNTNYFLY